MTHCNSNFRLNTNMTHIASTPLSRRTFLRAAGATLALPFLDAMRPVFGQTAVAAPRRGEKCGEIAGRRRCVSYWY